MAEVLEGITLDELDELEERFGVTVGSTASLWAFAPPLPTQTRARVARPARAGGFYKARKTAKKKPAKAASTR